MFSGPVFNTDYCKTIGNEKVLESSGFVKDLIGIVIVVAGS